jgi:hypothetical protein
LSWFACDDDLDLSLNSFDFTIIFDSDPSSSIAIAFENMLEFELPTIINGDATKSRAITAIGNDLNIGIQ